MSDTTALENHLDEQLAQLTQLAARTTGVCPVAMVIAASDSGVRETILRKLAEGNVPRGVRCVARGAVLFRFDCPRGVFCLVSPSFLVRVDLAKKVVTEIVDPFDPMESEPVAAGAEFLSLGSTAHFASTAKGTITGTATSDGDLLAATLLVRQIGGGFQSDRAMKGTGGQRSASITVPGGAVYEVAIDVTAADGTHWVGTVASGSQSRSSGKRTVMGGSDLWDADLPVA